LVEALLRRERRVVAAALLVLVVLAWAYVVQGAGMGMSAWQMTSLSLFPHRQAEVPGEMPVAWPILIAMWWVMMIGMMTPSAAPLVLLYVRVLRAHSPGAGVGRAAALLLAGYLAAWLGFSLAAAGLQQALQSLGWLSGMMLWSRSAWLSAAVLGLAGLYQLTAAKRACLTRCRSPVGFLTRHGRGASFMLGLRHGAYCVGCCGLLMALLFVGGVMNLVWIAVLTAVVLVEKLLPAGTAFGRALGGLLLLWAVATLFV
jgi:predicted metal-binding membrane protein